MFDFLSVTFRQPQIRRWMDNQRIKMTRLVCAIALLLTSAVIGDCGSATAPSSSAHLEIQNSAALKVGEQRAMAAVLVVGSTRQPASATWGVDSGTVIRFDAPNSVTGMVPGTVTIRASYQSYSATAQVDVVNDYSGFWVGTYRVDMCNRLSGGGSSYCRFILGGIIPLDLTLTQDAASVTGTVRFYSEEPAELLLSGAFSGASLPSGQLQLSGTLTSVASSDQPETTFVDGWQATLSTAGDMTGQFVKHRQFTNAFGPQVSIENCSLLSAQRSPVPSRASFIR